MMKITVKYETECDRYSIDIQIAHMLGLAMLLTEAELCKLMTQIGTAMAERID